MNSLKSVLKEEIKSLAKSQKETKAEIKRKQKAGECAASLQEKLVYSTENTRYHYLAYATVRQKDLSLVEPNPKKVHDPEKLKKLLDKITQKFESAEAV